MITLELREDERQALMLGLARVALERPGWRPYLRTIAQRAGAEPIYEALLKQGEREVAGRSEPWQPSPRLGTCLACNRRAFVVVDDTPPPVARLTAPPSVPHSFTRDPADPGRAAEDLHNAPCQVCGRPLHAHT